MSYSSLSVGRRKVNGVMVDNYEWTPLPGWSGQLEPEFRIDETLASSIQSISSDSRQVSSGTLFIAVQGENYDGHDFVNDAVERGAVGVVISTGRKATSLAVPQIEVSDTRRAVAAISAAFYDHPSRKMKLIGVTGTNGKSSTSIILHSLLMSAGLQAGLMTTIVTKIGRIEKENPTRLTLQEAPEVQRALSEMRESGCTHVILEATSIGLDLGRLDYCEFEGAIFTNLTPDHLDYHLTMSAYREAKGLLFSKIRPSGFAVINGMDAEASFFKSLVEGESVSVIEYSRDELVRLEMSTEGTRFRCQLVGRVQPSTLITNLFGTYNMENLLAAIRACEVLGLDDDSLESGIVSIDKIPGRLDVVLEKPVTVVVDYAHSEDSLRQTLVILREAFDPQSNQQIIVVIGSAGERDPERRYGIARALATDADTIILTDEDPRSEDSGLIIETIAHAVIDAGFKDSDHMLKIPDRRKAIARGLELARQGDILLVSGKGHETSIEYEFGSIAWSDTGVVLEEWNSLRDVSGDYPVDRDGD